MIGRCAVVEMAGARCCVYNSRRLVRRTSRALIGDHAYFYNQVGTFRARPAHALSHETPAKKINTIFCYLARQRDRPVHFAAVARENIARDNPAKNKNGSRAVFFVAALGKIFLM